MSEDSERDQDESPIDWLKTYMGWPAAEQLIEGRGYPSNDLFSKFKAGDLSILSAVTLEPLHYSYSEVRESLSLAEIDNDLVMMPELRSQASVSRARVDEIWPALRKEIVEPPPAKDRGGRPTKYHWADLSADVTAYVVANDYPVVHADMERWVLDWFQTHGETVPEKTAIRRWVKRLYMAGGRLK